MSYISKVEPSIIPCEVSRKSGLFSGYCEQLYVAIYGLDSPEAVVCGVTCSRLSQSPSLCLELPMNDHRTSELGTDLGDD